MSILLRQDPDMAAVLRPGDGQRIVRALEVLQASGRSIRQWQGERGSPLVDRSSARLIVIEPQRPLLIERIEARFARMVVDGAMAEVEALLALALDPALPALKAIGVRELGHGDRGPGHAGAGAEAGIDRDAPIRQAAIDMVPQPVGSGMEKGGFRLS